MDKLLDDGPIRQVDRQFRKDRTFRMTLEAPTCCVPPAPCKCTSGSMEVSRAEACCSRTEQGAQANVNDIDEKSTHRFYS